MKIVQLRTTKTIICACGCKELPRLDLVTVINNEYFNMYCGKIYRLHTKSIRWIKANFLNKG